MKKNQKLQPYLILAGSILLLLIYHGFGYIGHYGVDDLLYAKLANDWNNGVIDYDQHFSYRIPTVVLTAISYKIFGINDFASSVPALIFAIAILYLVFLVLKDQSKTVLSLGLGFTLLSDWFIFYTDKLMPDLYVAVAVFGALFVIQDYKFRKDKPKSPLKHGVGLALFLLFGFISKGTIVLFLPVLLFFFFFDLNKARHPEFWKITAFSTIGVFVLYFVITYLMTGAVLSRFEAIEKNAYLNLCSYDQQSVIYLVDRIIYQFFDMLVDRGMVTGYIFAFVPLFFPGVKSLFEINDRFSFYWMASLVLLVSSNFMSISVFHYVPMCLDPRHYLYLIPVVAVPAAFVVNDFLTSRKYGYVLLLCSLLAAIWAFNVNEKIYWNLYMPLFVLIGLVRLIPERIDVKLWATLGLLVVLGIVPLKKFLYASEVAYTEQRTAVIDNVLSLKGPAYVVTNDVQRNLCEYYAGYKTDKIKFLAYDEFREQDLEKGREVYLLKNWYTRYLSGKDEREIPFYARNIASSAEQVFNDSLLNISLYKLESLDNPDVVVFKSENDFEKKRIKHWRTPAKDRTNRFVFQGEFSHVVDEYSSTFEVSLNNLDFSKAKTVLITANLMCHFNKASNAKMVVQLDSPEGNYYWESMGVNRFIKAYNNWWPVKFEAFLPKGKLKPNSRLKVYMFNEDREDIYVDNFSVSIKKSVK